MTFLRRKRIRWPKVRTGRCYHCKGEGKVYRPIKAGASAVMAHLTCRACGGTGRDQHREE